MSMSLYVCVSSHFGSQEMYGASSYRVYTHIHYLKSCNALVKLGRCIPLKMGIVGRVCYLYGSMHSAHSFILFLSLSRSLNLIRLVKCFT